MTCEFCSHSECLDQCDWPVMNFVAMRVRDLQVGDQVRRFNEFAAKPSTAIVVDLRDFADGQRKITLQIEGRSRLRGASTPRLKVFTETRFAAIRIKRDTKCRKVCCELHRADRGPSAVVCADHWQAWRQVA